MIRKAFRMRVNEGAQEEHERRHRPIWKELEDTLIAHGVATYSIYLLSSIRIARRWDLPPRPCGAFTEVNLVLMFFNLLEPR